MASHSPFRFGVNAFGPPTCDGWVDLARTVGGLGYSTLSVDDHVHWPLSPVATLAVAAAATTTLRVGSLVFANDFRHPVAMARDAATLGVLTQGRFEFGIGTGYGSGDYEMTGIPLDPPGVRVDRLIEAVQIIKGAFGSEPFSFSGAHYTVRNLVPRPSLVQQPYPPLADCSLRERARFVPPVGDSRGPGVAIRSDTDRSSLPINLGGPFFQQLDTNTAKY